MGAIAADRPLHIYRLDVVYPADSLDEDGGSRRDWEPPNWAELFAAEFIRRYGAPAPKPDDEDFESFSWPRVSRHYLSRSGASALATRLRSYGATVTVVRSQPVTWPSGGGDRG